jgi:hypothetical protein
LREQRSRDDRNIPSAEALQAASTEVERLNHLVQDLLVRIVAAVALTPVAVRAHLHHVM